MCGVLGARILANALRPTIQELVGVSAQGAMTRKAPALPPMESVDQLTREFCGSRHTQENAKSPGSDGASPYLPPIVLVLDL
jgi:hypothetical protein